MPRVTSYRPEPKATGMPRLLCGDASGKGASGCHEFEFGKKGPGVMAGGMACTLIRNSLFFSLAASLSQACLVT